MTTLRETVQSVIDRWDSSEYAASELFEALRAALEQQAEPVKEQTFFCFNCDKNVTQGCFAPNCRPHWGK